MKLSEFVVEEAIIADLKSSERDDVIAELVDALIATGAATKSVRDDLISHLLTREKNGSTGFGKGVAVPHVKHAKIKKMSAAIGLSAAGVDFNAIDKQPVYSVFMVLSPDDQPDQHLQAMECIFGHLQKDRFRRFLQQATDTTAVIDLLQEADNQQLSS